MAIVHCSQTGKVHDVLTAELLPLDENDPLDLEQLVAGDRVGFKSKGKVYPATFKEFKEGPAGMHSAKFSIIHCNRDFIS